MKKHLPVGSYLQCQIQRRLGAESKTRFRGVPIGPLLFIEIKTQRGSFLRRRPVTKSLPTATFGEIILGKKIISLTNYVRSGCRAKGSLIRPTCEREDVQ